MSKYTIEHSCGHNQDVQLYGPTRDRDSKAEWMGSRVCPECYAANRQAERETANAAARATNQAAGLPALTGSPKQISWAESIRMPILTEARALCESMSRDPAKRDAHTVLRYIPEFANWITAQSAAHWWIDRRNLSMDSAIKMLAGCATGQTERALGAVMDGLISGRQTPATLMDHWADWMERNHKDAITAWEVEQRQARDKRVSDCVQAVLDHMGSPAYDAASDVVVVQVSTKTPCELRVNRTGAVHVRQIVDGGKSGAMTGPDWAPVVGKMVELAAEMFAIHNKET